MQRNRLVLFFIVLISIALGRAGMHLQAQDGIPDNCENQRGEFYRQTIFPRYEPQNSRLVLVDWASGADVMILGENLADTRILGWSVDCRYLATAIGSVDSMDTVVWDTVNGGQTGRVADAHQRPHTITWGPGNYLVVETRNGAILWNVGANTQITLTTAYDTLSGRNFSRLRWNTTHNQLTVNLAIGGRVVYDLTTGQETVALPAENDLVQTVPENSVVIGGHPYECRYSGQDRLGGYNYSLRQTYNVYYGHYVYVSYDQNSQVLFLEVSGYGNNEGPVQVLADNLAVSYIENQGWSSDCRYLALSLHRTDTTERLSDTVVWDVIENRRVGTFEGARQISHPVHWGVNSSLVIETRDGAYLWHIPTDTRTLLTDYVETALTGYAYIHSFSQLTWDPENGQLHAILLEDPQTVTVFDSRTGSLLETYPVDRRALPGNTLSTSSRASGGVQGQVIVTPLDGTNGMTGVETVYHFFNYYQPDYIICNGLSPYYDATTRELSVRNGETRLILDDDANHIYKMIWSPDCRIFAVEESFVDRGLGYDNSPTDDSDSYQGGATIRFFALDTSQQIAEIDHPYRSRGYSAVWWSPSGERVLVRSNSGFYLVNLVTGDTLLLTFSFGDYTIDNYTRAYWDYERGQILVSGSGGMHSFDMQTGVERFRIPASSGFSVDDNNQILFGGSHVYDLDTLEYSAVDVDLPNYAFTGDLSALSPDGRYLVMAWNMIRVWDLTDLPEEFNDRDPIYRYQGPDARIRLVRFVDNVTIETTSARGVQYWNVETGAEVMRDG